MKKWRIATLVLVAVLVVLIPWSVVVSQSLLTMRAIFNKVYDRQNNVLKLNAWSGPSAADSFLTETDILNKVYDAANNRLLTDGGGGGTGNVDVSGTPTSNQVATWVDNNTVQGVSSLSLNITDLDLTGATRTAPNKTGTTPPGTCTVGDTFFDSDAAAGSNLYGCTSTNTWTLLGTGSATFADGTTSAPSITFTSSTQQGWHRVDSNLVAFDRSGAIVATFGNHTSGSMGGGVAATSFGLGASTPDIILSRAGGANLRLGAPDSATPVAQTLSVQNASGTNISVAAWTQKAPLGTGTGTVGLWKVQAAAAAQASGTTAHTAVDHLTVGAGKVIANAHVESSGTAPSIGGSCGTSPSIVGTDVSGKLTTGTGAPTSCTLTFATAWTNAPACSVTNETTANLARAISTTTTVVLSGTFVAGDVLAYVCLGRV